MDLIKDYVKNYNDYNPNCCKFIIFEILIQKIIAIISLNFDYMIEYISVYNHLSTVSKNTMIIIYINFNPFLEL